MRAAALLSSLAFAAMVIWLVLAPHSAAPARAYTTPVNRDYVLRDRLIAFEEQAVRTNLRDQITRRMLAQQYLMRFREQGDVGDIARAQGMARRSIQLQPQGNTQAQMALASALLTYHDFRGALVHEDAAIAGEPFNNNAWAQRASLLMEVGRYAAAGAILRRTIAGPTNPTWDSVLARYDELTGKIGAARALLDRCERIADSTAFMPAYDRSYYHFRAAQLAFEAGDNADSDREFHEALRIYPDNSMAWLFLARLYRGERRWNDALAAATRSADLYPLPQALGYKADAERALGLSAQAERTDALILAEERLFNVQGINDRLMANYFAQRHEHLRDALVLAQEDYRKRGDEIYADDTLARVYAALGNWSKARTYAMRATRLGTQDPALQYHAGIIAMRTGHCAEGMRRLRWAENTNPDFSPFADALQRPLRASACRSFVSAANLLNRASHSSSVRGGRAVSAWIRKIALHHRFFFTSLEVALTIIKTIETPPDRPMPDAFAALQVLQVLYFTADDQRQTTRMSGKYLTDLGAPVRGAARAAHKHGKSREWKLQSREAHARRGAGFQSCSSCSMLVARRMGIIPRTHPA